MVSGDTAPQFLFSVSRPDGTVPSLTSATVDFIMESPAGTLINTGHTACTMTSLTAGEGYYTFVTGDLAESGNYNCDLQITYASGKIETVPKKIVIYARPQSA